MKQLNKNKYLIVVGGPTASGKTAFAIRLAQHFNAPIVSADSRQFYREMNIGTAKPTAEELSMAPHYLINSLSIEEEYNVGRFEDDALRLLENLFQNHDVAVLAGGSGLYIKALCEGLDEFPEVLPGTRNEVEKEYQAKGLSYLQEELKRIDPNYYKEVDRRNPHRLIRAIAVFRSSGQPFSSFRKAHSSPRPFTPIYLQLHWPRQELYQRINQRVEQMVASGLMEEARVLYPRRKLTALLTVGYQELFGYFEGLSTLEEAVALIQRNSRRYAKRQLTWYRRDGHWKLLRPNDWEVALEYIEAVRTEGIRLRCHKPAPSHSLPAGQGNLKIQLMDKDGERASLYYSEKIREALLQGPFLRNASADGWAGLMLVHQGALLAVERQAFSFSTLDKDELNQVCQAGSSSPEMLPNWMRAHWKAFRDKYADSGIWSIQ